MPSLQRSTDHDHPLGAGPIEGVHDGDTNPGSILLGTSDGDRLRAWYRAALAPKETRDGFLSFGGVEILVDGRTDLASVDPEPGRVILNFYVDDARATAAHLTEVGVCWLVELEEREAGLFATLLDPDGNYVQIVELARSEPGFKDEPDCFMVDTYELDEDVWVCGFVSIDQDDQANSPH